MDQQLHSAATGHLPWFITPPGSPDILFYIVVVFLVAAVLFVGNLYFQLHALPEHISHRTNKVQVELVAVLALIALFTHQHIFWIAALLLALIDLPDFSTPIYSMAGSLERMAQAAMGRGKAAAAASPPPQEAPASPVEDIAPPTEITPAAPATSPVPVPVLETAETGVATSDKPARGE